MPCLLAPVRPQASYVLYGFARLGLCPSEEVFLRGMQKMGQSRDKFEFGNVSVAAWSLSVLGLVHPKLITGEIDDGDGELHPLLLIRASRPSRRHFSCSCPLHLASACSSCSSM